MPGDAAARSTCRSPSINSCRAAASLIDRRSVRVRLTGKGRHISGVVSDLFGRHASGLMHKGALGASGMDDITRALKRMERYWTDQIRYIY